jgi:prepilin-type N-terminal cleavage/methylation domain-containing protein
MKAQRQAFTLVELLVVIAIIGILVSLTLPAVQAAREAGRRTQCKNSMRNIALALINHHDTVKRLPPMSKYQSGNDGPCGAGKWMDDQSWMIATYPYLELQNAYDRYDHNVCLNHANNKDARSFKPEVFGCATDGLKENQFGDTANQRVRTNYAANGGNTNYGQSMKGSVAYGGAPFSPGKGKNFSAIDDGLSNTLLLAEVITVGEEQTGWGGPISDTLASYGGQSFQAYYTPNATKDFDEVTQCPSTSALNGMPGCKTEMDINLQCFVARSKHKVGVHVALCDGSVQFIANNIAANIWQAAATAKGKEATSLNQ